MRDALHAGMLAQIVHHLEGIGHMAFYTQGQTLYTLQQYPCIEGRDGGSSITQDDSTDACHKCCCACHIGKDGSMIRGVGLGQSGISVGKSNLPPSTITPPNELP